MKDFDVVVITDFYDEPKIIEFDEFCRKKKIGFIYAGALGLYTYCFVDFGNNHLIRDPDGSDPKEGLI